jgi:hypothetical protein
MRAQFINGMLAFWLFVSVFLWPHTRFEVESSMLVALAVMCFACAAITGARWARHGTVVLGAWLIAAGIVNLATTSSRLTPIHNLIVGLLLSGFGMMRDVGRWYADSELEPGPNTVGFTPADEVTVLPSPRRG